MKRKQLPHSWFAGDAVDVARVLLGKVIRFDDCEGIIVETEAYTIDEASHGKVLTPRSKIMHDTYGHWYVYFTYGMHFCANVTTNKGGVGAVLIRAVEPTKGIELMEKRRKTLDIKNLCSGPAKFCQAFGISLHENTLPVKGMFTIYDAPEIPDADIVASPRIGIRRATQLPWRFTIRGSKFTSR